MRQIGVVSSVSGTSAYVAVRRMSACEGCHKANPGMASVGDVTYASCHECSMFPVETEMTVLANNGISASPGDRVLIESSTEQILGYAVAVFLLPLLLAFLGGIAGAYVTTAAWAPYLGAVIGFVGAFVFVKTVVDRHAKEKTVYTVVRVLTTDKRNGTPDGTDKSEMQTMEY